MATWTEAQRQTLKTYILANYGAWVTSGDYSQIADALNGASNPAFIVWKSRVDEEAMHASYVWTEMDSLTQARFNSLTLLLKPGFVNPSSANVRQGLSDIFSAPALANTKAALIALAKRTATVAEKVLATGTGTVATPATMGWEGTISVFEIGGILA